MFPKITILIVCTNVIQLFLLILGLSEPSNKENYTQSKPSTSDNDLWKKEDSLNESEENETTIEYVKAVCTVKPVLKRPGLLEDPSPNKKNQIYTSN